MEPYKFMSYIATPSEKHLGIATVCFHDKIILRFKVIPNKEGQGFFFGTSAFKISKEGEEDRYIESFIIDSRFENENLQEFLRSNVKREMQNSSAVSNRKIQNPFIQNKSQEEQVPF